MSEVALDLIAAKVLDEISGSAWTVYPQYKDSGVNWLGEVPVHWGVKRLKYQVSKIGSGKTPRGGAEVYVPEGIMLIRSQNVYDDGLRLDDVVFIDEGADAEMSSTRVSGGDVLLNITGASIGRAAIVPDSIPLSNVNQHVCIIRPVQRKLLPDFLHGVLCSKPTKEQILADENGTSREGLNFRQVGNLFLCDPPPNEQAAIASFLDRETARIDALIAKKRQLIDLLQEKRTALISQAVTKGLDPGVPMKDSGVEWLGEIPAHWEVSRIKFIVTTPVTDGPHETPEILTDGIPFVSAEAINNGKINFTKIRGHISEEEHKRFSRKYCPKFGDIYMVKSGATTGRVAMVEDDRVFNIWSPLAAIRCDIRKANRRFVYHYLQSKEFQSGVQLRWSFGTQQNIGMGVIQNLAMAPRCFKWVA